MADIQASVDAGGLIIKKNYHDNGDGTFSEVAYTTSAASPSSLGQKTMANSAPVVIASDQSAVAISNTLVSAASADGRAASATPGDGVLVWNGTNFDRIRNNISGTAIASGPFTTTQTVADILTYNARYLDVILDMTTVGTGSVTLTINGKDPASGKYYPLLAGAPVITNSTNVYRVGPGLLAAANSVANFALTKIIQIVVTANNANSATYSVGYNLSV